MKQIFYKKKVNISILNLQYLKINPIEASQELMYINDEMYVRRIIGGAFLIMFLKVSSQKDWVILC